MANLMSHPKPAWGDSANWKLGLVIYRLRQDSATLPKRQVSSSKDAFHQRLQIWPRYFRGFAGVALRRAFGSALVLK
jgi:hypothetical protein